MYSRNPSRQLHHSVLVRSLKAAVFTVMGTIEPRVVKLFPTTTCSCPAKINCYHIKAAEMAVGLAKESTKHRITLTQLRRNKRKKADKKFRSEETPK